MTTTADAKILIVDDQARNLDALEAPPLTDSELAEIDRFAVDSGVNLWAKQTEE